MTSIDPPFFHFLFKPFGCNCLTILTSNLFRFRWFLTRPLEIRILPKWMQLPYISHITMGDILLALPLILLFCSSYNDTFIDPHVQKTGHLASYAMFAVFLTANKTNNIITLLLGIPFERLIAYHKASSLTCLVLAGFHSRTAFLSYNLSAKDELPFIEFVLRDQHNTTGALLFGTLALLIMISIIAKLRRLWFELWFYAHIILAACVILFSILHQIYFIYFFMTWWLLDMILRYAIMAGCIYRTEATLSLIPGTDVVRVVIPKIMEYNPGQFVQLCIPQLSRVQYHPISIASAPHEEKMTFYIKAVGNTTWTQALLALANSNKTTNVRMEGPYGKVCVDLERPYTMVLVVCGGIGVTHCQSVATHLIHQHNHTMGQTLHRLQFVWAIRELALVEGIDLMRGIPQQQQEEAKTFENCSEVAPRSIVNLDRNGEIIVEIGDVCGQPVIQTDIYYTREVQEENDNAGHVPQQCNLILGRPNLDLIVKEMEGDAILKGVDNVAVFGCGPGSLMADLRDACERHSPSIMDCGGITFDLHLETFEF